MFRTKFGHDLFRTFEYWIDEKAQKKVARKKQINNVVKEGGKLRSDDTKNFSRDFTVHGEL